MCMHFLWFVSVYVVICHTCILCIYSIIGFFFFLSTLSHQFGFSAVLPMWMMSLQQRRCCSCCSQGRRRYCQRNCPLPDYLEGEKERSRNWSQWFSQWLFSFCSNAYLAFPVAFESALDCKLDRVAEELVQKKQLRRQQLQLPRLLPAEIVVEHPPAA